MGTTLHAIVERLEDGQPGLSPDRWHAMSTWHFNKHYDLSIALTEAQPDVLFGWPDDVSFEARHLAVTDCAQVFTPEELPAGAEFGVQYHSLVRSLESLVGRPRRILFYRI